MEQNVEKKKFQLKMPGTMTILLFMICFAAVLSIVLPSGEFDRVLDPNTNRNIVVAGTYKFLEKQYITPGGFLTVLYRGFMDAADIVVYLIMMGAGFGMLNKSGAIEAGLGKVIKKSEGKEHLFIIFITFILSACGGLFGLSDQLFALVPLILAVCIQLGYDPMVGAAVCIAGTYSGYSAGPMNPYNTGVGQRVSELPLFSGIEVRTVFLVIVTLITIHHISRYAKSVKNKENRMDGFSYVGEEIQHRDMTKMDKIILIIFGITIAILVYGITLKGWYFKEMGTLFFLMGLITGMLYHNGNLDKVMSDALDGAKGYLVSVFVLGLSRAVMVCMQDTAILDTVVYYISLPLSKVPPALSACGMYVAQGIINFLLPTSSGQAVVTMPILYPIGDIIGLTRQTVVFAFQCGDGFWNMICPGHYFTMIILGMAGIPYGRWLKFIVGLLLKWSVMTFAFLIAMALLHWGPF